jgi:AcrR family transcriptional regulator
MLELTASILKVKTRGTVMPRRYASSVRDAAYAETRGRIVEAAQRLYAGRGVRATSWQDIANAADVSVVTVYRHFRSLAELIPACTLSFIDSVAPMSQAEALAAFRELSTPLKKLEKLIVEDCACYERGEDWFRVVIRERDLIPELDEMARSAEKTLATLVGAALEGTPAPAELHFALRALIDFPFWLALVSAGVHRSHAPSVMHDLAASLLDRHGISFRDG